MGKSVNKKKVVKKEVVKKGNKKVASGKKYQIENLPRFIIAAIIILVVIIVIFTILGRKEPIDTNTNISDLNAKKYDKEILAEYEKEGQKLKFIKDQENIQSKIGIYIINNSTIEENSFDEMKTKLETILASNDWKELEIQKPTFWNGTWSLDDKGNVKFKFQVKAIEPSWATDKDMTDIIILN